MANLGVGLGSFLSGLSNGARTYETIQGMRENRLDRQQARQDRDDLRQIGQQGTYDANAAREADIGKSITVGQDVSSGVAKPVYTVNGKSFNTQADAHAHAEKNVGSFMDYYSQKVMPKYQEHWLQTGEVDKAQAADKWMQDAEVQRGMKSWAGAVRSYQTGDREGFKNNLMSAYNNEKYFDDGTKALGIEDVNDDKGNLRGYKIRFQGKDGKETEQTFDSDDVGKMALNALSPAQVLSYGIDQLKQGESARAQLAKEGRAHQYRMAEKGLDLQAQNARAGQTQQNAQDNIRLRATLERDNKLAASRDPRLNKKVQEAQAASDYLRGQGYSDEYVKAQLPRLLGVEAQRMSPENRLNNAIKVLGGSDLGFGGLSQEEQVSKARGLIEAQDRALAQMSPGTPAGNKGVGLPGAANGGGVPVQSGKGVPVYDTKTNSIIYR